MSKILGIFICSFLLFSSTWATLEDNSIVKELNKTNTKELKLNFKMKTFESCEAFEDVIGSYMKDYWENNYKWGINRPYIGRPIPMIMESEVMADEGIAVQAKTSALIDNARWDDFSKTNTQVSGVDESDIVKTDGKYIYYYNETKKAVFIVETNKAGVFSEAKPELIKKINLPKNFYNLQLYVTNNRLVIIAGGYSQGDYLKRGYYINRNSKTYTVVFDLSDHKNPKLIKLHISDGSYSKSRRIGDYVYVLSRNSFSYPYWNIKSVDDIQIDAEKFLPKKLEISRTDNKNEQNLEIKNTQLPYRVTAGSLTDCSSISYSFPDEETMKNTNFNPGYNIISSINIAESDAEVKTKIIAGSNSEIYMSTENLYMTEGIWQADNYSCPADALCAMPFFWGGTQNTLIHKLNIDKEKISYQDTTLVPGSPLTQYSMDEYNGNFRIITTQWSPERSTGLYILDKDLKKIGDLTSIAPGENFQSSRFIGNKLFLVTFKQIDPLFAIDVSDVKQPKILGELKIPGFSTYLHPYDENHLIGLGYDIKQNKWGGTQTAGIKIDLYKINYDKKCGDQGLTVEQEKKCVSWDYKGIIVEQIYTKILGGKGSYSEALNNPRMFVWNSDRKTLLLPATLYERDDNYKTTDYYNGLFSLNIDSKTGIRLLWKTSHIDMTGIEEEREKECSKYSGSSADPVCKELLNGEMYCETPRENRYVPNYCYKDASVWQYVGDNAWKFRNMNIKRALYIGENVYGISDKQIGNYDWNLKEKWTMEF